MSLAAVLTLGISGVLCFGANGENSVKLTPSPVAIAKEGETLYLQCDYTGLLNPDFINWYLNNDTYGLVIDARLNRIQIQPKGYETERFTTSCNATSFTLSIANILQAKDGGDKWECDVTIIGMQPPSKASTIVEIIEADEKDDKSGTKYKTTTMVYGIMGGLVILSVGVLLSVAVILITTGRVICRKTKKNVINGYVINCCAIHWNSKQSYTQKEIDGDDFRTTKSDISDNMMPLNDIRFGENQRIRVEDERPLNNQAILKNLPEKGNKLAYSTEKDIWA